MSKTSKLAKSTPEIYANLSPSVQRQGILLVIDHAGHSSIHNNRKALEALQSFNALIRDTIYKTYAGFSEFCEEGKQTILAYHDTLFGAIPPKNQNIMQTTVYVWNKLLATATADLSSEVPVSATGRKSTIGLCEYRKGENADKPNMLKTPQANACLRIFIACIGTQEMVTEEILKQYIIDHASELHTRQDPWRIFQYYRPQLISEKLITRK